MDILGIGVSGTYTKNMGSIREVVDRMMSMNSLRGRHKVENCTNTTSWEVASSAEGHIKGEDCEKKSQKLLTWTAQPQRCIGIFLYW